MSTDYLTSKQYKFGQEYCIDLDGTKAAIRAGYAESSAAQEASRQLKNVKVLAYIEQRKQELATQAMLTPSWVLDQWHKIATADNNELTQLRRVNCRYCHGYGHQYQWTESEYAAALNVAIERGRAAPDGMGGFGFNQKADPNLACPECVGEGVEYLHVADTRNLKGKARLLYAGVQKTKDGLKILTRDQDAALVNISKFLGMSLDRKEISGPGGGPVPLAHLSAADLTDDQLATILAAVEPPVALPASSEGDE